MQTETEQARPPEPEVSREKRFFAEEGILLAQKAQIIDDTAKQKALEEKSTNTTPEQIDAHTRALTSAYLDFYSEAKGVMRALKPHLAEQDRKEFTEIWKDLCQDSTELYQTETTDRLCEYILQALKNANLTELGKKSRINEIINEIDISDI